MALKIAKDLSLPLDAVTQTFAALGRRGSGKTSTAVVMAEEMLRAGQVIVWLDPIGVAWGLRSEFPILIAGGERGDIPLEATGGKLMAEFLVENRVPCILDVSLFGENEMRRFVGEFAATFYRINREPVHWFVDEADEFAPQSGFNAEAAKCLGAMQNIVRRGRARGIGVTLITQRSAVLNKSVLTQTECLFAMQTTAPHDLKAIEDWIKYHGTAEECKVILRDVPKLQQGECYVYSPGWLKLLKRTKIRQRDTHDSSRTPKPGERKTEPKTLAQVDLASLKGQMAATVEKAKANDPKELQRRIRELEAAAKKQQPAAAPDQGAIDRAVKAAETARDRHWQGEIAKLTRDLKDRNSRLQKIEQTAHLNGEATISVAEPPAVTTPARFPAPIPQRTVAARVAVTKVRSESGSTAGGELTGPERRILDAIAWMESLGITEPEQTAVAFLAGYTVGGGAFNNPRGALRTKGLIEYRGNRLELTESGREIASFPDVTLTSDELQRRVMERLPGPEQRILQPLLDAYPNDLSNEELAEKAGYEIGGGAFNNPKGRLRTLGLIEYPNRGRVVALPLLFLES